MFKPYWEQVWLCILWTEMAGPLGRLSWAEEGTDKLVESTKSRGNPNNCHKFKLPSQYMINIIKMPMQRLALSNGIQFYHLCLQQLYWHTSICLLSTLTLENKLTKYQHASIICKARFKCVFFAGGTGVAGGITYSWSWIMHRYSFKTALSASGISKKFRNTIWLIQNGSLHLKWEPGGKKCIGPLVNPFRAL